MKFEDICGWSYCLVMKYLKKVSQIRSNLNLSHNVFNVFIFLASDICESIQEQYLFIY